MPNRHGLLIAVLFALIPMSACQRGPGESQVAQPPDSSGLPAKGVDRSHAGEPLPAAEIYNADDDASTLGEAAGTPLLVNLWATWCVPCVKELPTLDALSQRPGAPKVIAVSEDVGERPSIDAFLDRHGIGKLETWRDPTMALSSAIGVQVMPTTIYYDASGKELWRYVGDLDWTGGEAARLLAEAGPAEAG